MRLRVTCAVVGFLVSLSVWSSEIYGLQSNHDSAGSQACRYPGNTAGLQRQFRFIELEQAGNAAGCGLRDLTALAELMTLCTNIRR
jgi:hypothetical protein